MCKHYQITYTCLHLAPIETSLCSLEQRAHNQAHQGSCVRGIELHDQRAPHKCKACRNYDRDRWRRGWPPRPLPPAPHPAQLAYANSEHAMLDSEDEAEEREGSRGRRVRLRVRPVEHIEGRGGASPSGPNSGLGSAVSDARSCATVGHDLRHRTRARNDTPSSIAAEIEQIERELGAIRCSPKGRIKGRTQSRSPQRSRSLGRLGGFGGKRAKGNAKLPAMGDLSLSRGSSRSSSYRGADMEMGGSSLGLDMGDNQGGGGGGLADFWLRMELEPGAEERRMNLDGESAGFRRIASSSGRETGGLGLGFGGFDMDNGGSISPESDDTEGSLRRRPRRQPALSQDAKERDNAEDDGDESRNTDGDVADEFLDDADRKHPPSRTTGDVSTGATVVEETRPGGGEASDDSQESVAALSLDF